MKNYIKELSKQQGQRKKSRKTGSKPTNQEIWRVADVQSEIHAAKVKITAALNFQHELKGSSYRHGVDSDLLYWYNRELERLKEKSVAG